MPRKASLQGVTVRKNDDDDLG